MTQQIYNLQFCGDTQPAKICMEVHKVGSQITTLESYKLYFPILFVVPFFCMLHTHIHTIFMLLLFCCKLQQHKQNCLHNSLKLIYFLLKILCFVLYIISSIKLVLLLLCMTYVVSTAAVAVSCGKKLIHYFLMEEEEMGSLKIIYMKHIHTHKKKMKIFRIEAKKRTN